jgi:uncharacterized protein YprB with RNaseH-like and TPR domain
MLKNTFIHITHIGEERERRLWDCGIKNWDDFLSNRDKLLPLTGYDFHPGILNEIEESCRHLEKENASYFGRMLSPNYFWRMFSEFRHTAVYLDIETTGLSSRRNVITTIALYDGRSIKYYIRGENLDDFYTDVMEYKMLVTYNGRLFDIPFIENEFRIKLGQVHSDLRFLLKSLRIGGGLKSCERQLGISRGELDNVDGYHAVLFWRDYVTNGNRKALETLLAYNIEDVVNLEKLMLKAYNMKAVLTPFSENILSEEPGNIDIPFTADLETIEKVNRYRCLL